MRLPADNKFVDENGRIVEAWYKVFERLAPLLDNIESLNALLGVAEEADETGALGDIQYRGPSGLLNLPIGAIGALLAVNAAGNAPEWGGISSWIDPITSVDASVGNATESFTDIDTGYSHLAFYFDRVSGTANNTFFGEFDETSAFASLINAFGTRIQLTSGAATVTLTSSTNPAIGYANAAGPFTGWGILFNYSNTSTHKLFLMFSSGSSGTSVANIAIYTIESTVIINNVRFGFSTGTLDGGNIYLGGIR